MSVIIYTLRSLKSIFLLFSYCYCVLFAGNVNAQENSEDETILIEVIGTRIKRIDVENASPVTVISRAKIEKSGKTSIADILRDSSVNTFGSQKSSSGGTEQGQAKLNLRGLGSARTLILVNGRRVANSSATSDSQNLNLIPLVAVEKIEVLRDGASSIYGSDAVGGVVNVILRKDVDFNSITAYIGRPSRRGGDENYLSFSGGLMAKNSSITYAVSHNERENILNNERDITAVGFSQLGYPGSYIIKADNPLPDGPNIITTSAADPRCPEELFSEPDFPNSVEQDGVCLYNFAALSDHIPEFRRSSFYVAGNMDLSSSDEVFGQVSYNVNKSMGISAPTPQAGGNIFYPTMAASNVNNPTQGKSFELDTDNDGIIDTTIVGPFDLDILYRNLPGGQRFSEVEDESIDVLFGIEGDFNWFMSSSYKLGLQYSRNESQLLQRGLARRDLLQQSIDDGSFDIFSVNNPIDLDLAASFVTDSEFKAKYEVLALDASFSNDLYETTHGTAKIAYGFDLNHQVYASRFGDAFGGDLIDGRAGGGSAYGKRDIASIFGEVSLPLVSNVELSIAMRLDNYSDFGSALSPKIGFTWRPTESLLFRSTYGQGFRAPSLFDLFSAANQSFPFAKDLLRCEASGDADRNGIVDNDQEILTLPLNSVCRPQAIQTINKGNPELDAEHSSSFTVGTLYQPSDNFRLEFSFFSSEFDKGIGLYPLFDLLALEADQGAHPQVRRDELGRIIQIDLMQTNFFNVTTTGFDLSLEYSWAIQQIGEFQLGFDLASTLMLDIETKDGQTLTDVDAIQGGKTSRFNFYLNWEYQNWSAQVSAIVIPDQSFQGQNMDLGTYVPIDAQLSWKISWGGRLSIGARNILNKLPPSSLNLGFPYYQTTSSDITGRVPYIRYSQSF